jgi:thiamine-phosphate pyrophosphorylase
MRIALLSSPENFAGEHEMLEAMFQNGLTELFLRKPRLNDVMLERWVLGLAYAYHPLVRPWHGSGHSFAELVQWGVDGTYILSPVFDSISKIGYQSPFSRDTLAREVADWKAEHPGALLYALGGVDAETLPLAEAFGFDGAIAHGAVWNHADPVGAWGELSKNI